MYSCLLYTSREERDAHVLVLRQRAADDLTGLIGDLIAQGQNLCLADIFHEKSVNATDLLTGDTVMLPLKADSAVELKIPAYGARIYKFLV